MKRSLVSFLILAGGLLLGGCKTYQYRIVEPARFAQPIARQTVAVAYEPLEYRFVRRDDRIAMRVVNPTDQPVRILGEKSYLVDPLGETHPLGGALIAPRSYIGTVLPPRPIVVRSNPSFTFGLGFGSGYSRSPFYPPYSHFGWGLGHPYARYGGYYHDPFFYDTPSYQILTPYDWEWRKEGTIRMHLTYEQEGKTFGHDLVLERQRVR